MSQCRSAGFLSSPGCRMLRGLGPDPFPNGVPLKGTETLKKSGVALGDSVSERVEEEKENEEVVHESEIAFRLDGVERLLGSRPLQILRNSHVAVVGVGGVGSWVVEALARSGVGRLTLIDLDDVCVSNVNRQLCALTSTVGELKIDVLKARVREINPACDVRLIADFVVPDNAGDLLFEQEWGAPDLVVECIDTASEKCAIIEECRKRNTPVVVAGSVGGKFDPTKVEVSDLGRTHGDALLFQVRKKLRSKFGFPGRPASPRKKEKDRDWGVAAVYVPESFETSSAFSPSSSDSSSSPSDSEEDLSFSSTTKREDVEEDGEQGLDCTRFGTVAFLSGTVGMTAASAAVRILALNEQTYRWQPALLALGREGEEVGEGQNAPSEGMEDGKEAGEEREKASGVIGKSEPGEQKQEAGTEGGKGGRKVNGAPGGSGVAVAGSSGPLPLQPVELLQVADAHCHLHLTKRKDARSEREVVGDMQRDGGKTVALQSLSERVRGEGEEKGEAAIAVSGDLETLRERGASSSTSAAARASSSSSSAPQKPPPTKPGPSLPIPNDSKDQTGVSQGTIPGDAPPTPIHPPQKLTAPPLPADSAPGPARFPLQFREAAERVKEAADAGVSPLMLCAVSPLSDWSLVECLATERGRGEVVSNFGLHPWWIEPMLRTQQSHSPSASEGSSANDRLLSSLSSHLDLFLRRNLNAGVGECGLDKPHSKRTGTSLDFQTDVLRVHFRKAKEFKRPLTLHCVQAYGRLLDVLQEERKRGAERGSDMSHPCPPSSSASSFQHRESQQEETASSSGCKSASPKAFDVPVILHSFSGPVDLVPRFAEANCFFSVAPFLLRQGVSGGGGGGPSSSPQALKGNKGKGGSVSLSPGASLLRKIPSDRLLLESDCPDGLGRTHLTLGVEEENGGDRESGATLVREVCRRGGENTSALLPLWCETVAKALGVETVALAAQTTSNLRRVLACISRV